MRKNIIAVAVDDSEIKLIKQYSKLVSLPVAVLLRSTVIKKANLILNKSGEKA